MKASEAFLLAVHLAGGEITQEKVAGWLTQLEKSHLVDRVYHEDPEHLYQGIGTTGQTPKQPIRFQTGEYRLTEAALIFLRKKGYIR